MVIDTSAFVAYASREPARARLLVAIRGAQRPCLSAVALVEVSMVLSGRGGPGTGSEFDTLPDDAGVEVVPATRQTAEIARAAFLAYGKGRHPTALNSGDCFSYALVVERREPLLFVGNDFALTNVDAAPY